MPEQHAFFAYLSRMRYINRWGLMRNTFQENIQEHSHMVAVLAHALAVIGRERFGGTVDPGQAAAAALFHDAPEILTGDLPTPVKYYNPEIRDAYKEVEEVSARKLLSMLPDELRPAYEGLLMETAAPGVGAVVKAADKLSAYIKCLEELEAGNNEFGDAAGEILEALRRMELEEVTWFLEHFAEAFGLTLDGLQRGQGGP